MLKRLTRAIELLDELYKDIYDTDSPGSPDICDAYNRIGVVIAMLRDDYDPDERESTYTTPRSIHALSKALTEPKDEACDGCKGLGWSVRERGDGRYAVECCDMCSGDDFSDSDAAVLASNAGISCDDCYPCVLKDQSPEAVERANQIVDNLMHGLVFRTAAEALLKGIPAAAMVTCPTCCSTRVESFSPDPAYEFRYECLDCHNRFRTNDR